MDDATATMVRAREIEARERKVRFVAEYMLQSAPEWNGCLWEAVSKAVRMDYLHKSRAAIEACSQWDRLHE